jgi:hypothetical protein
MMGGGPEDMSGRGHGGHDMAGHEDAAPLSEGGDGKTPSARDAERHRRAEE